MRFVKTITASRYVLTRVILDTNVVSELIKETPNQQVTDWLSRQSMNDLYLTTIIVAELFYGASVLPAGKRKNQLLFQLEQFAALFNGRIFSFDLAASRAYAEIMANAKTNGLAIQKADGYIAAVAKVQQTAVATRDVSPFLSANVAVINPWEISA